MSREDSLVLSVRLLDPYERCGICGLPNRIRAAYVRTKRYAFLGHRLTLDHLDPRGPGTLENLRILCGLCNRLRGAAMYTDGEVLKKARRWWMRRLTSEEAWWLVGEGTDLDRRGKRHGA